MPSFRHTHHRAAAIKQFVVLLLLAGLVSCGSLGPTASTLPSPITITLSTPEPTLTPPPKTAQPVSSETRKRWLAAQPCAPPCWEGITPGKTDLHTAVAILNRHPQITGITIYPQLLDEGMVDWRWNGSDWGGQLKFPEIDVSAAGNTQDAANPIITSIAVAYPQSFSLAEIRAAYGDPSHVAPSFFSGATAHFGQTRFFDLSLVYLPQGFSVETERTYGPAPEIKPTMKLTRWVQFFPPITAGSDILSDVVPTPLVPWQGFQDFTSYCRQVQPANDPPDDGVLSCPNVISELRSR